MNASSSAARGESGFSLLELMIAVVILGVITSQLFLALTAQQRGNRSESAAVDVQETTRLVLDLIAFDTRNAGMLVPREVAVASVDGGPTDSDRFCVSDGSIFVIPPPPPPGVQPTAAQTFWSNLDHDFDGATGNTPTDVLNLSSLNIEDGAAGGAANDFAVGAGVIVASGGRIPNDPSDAWVPSGPRAVFCARVTQILANTVTMDQAVPTSGGAFLAGTQFTAVPAIIYEITHPMGDPNQTLLLRNGIPISDQIEDLQVQYWVDSTTDGLINGTAEWPLDQLDGQDTSRIRRVRISALGRTRINDTAGGEGLVRHHRPGMANRDASPTYDSFDREIFVTSVLPRNLFDYLENPNATVPSIP